MAIATALTDNLALAVSSLLALSLLYIGGWAVYNVFFHPLRSFPGPLLWRVTSLPWAISKYHGKLEREVQSLHLKYGLVVRVGPNELSYASGQAFTDILAHKAGREECSKARIPKSVNGSTGILTANREDHARFRRLLSHAFSDKGLREQQSHIEYHVDLLVRRLSEVAQRGESTDIISWFNMTTFDVIGDLTWGESFGCLESGGHLHEWIPSVMGNVKYVSKANVASSWGLDWLNPYIVTAKDRADRLKNHKFAVDRVKKRASMQGQARGDFWDRILIKSAEENKAGEGMTEAEMMNNASALVLGGSETSATALSGTLYLLSKHPEIREKLKDEVRTSFTSEEEIDAFSVQRLKYMFAVLEEAMRFYPPVATPAARASPRGGTTICGQYIPEGIFIAISILAAHRHPSNFYDPEGFHPERWLPDAPPEFSQDDRKAFLPFSIGTRNCIGRNLAYAEMRLILAKLLWNFDFELDAQRTRADWFDQETYTLWIKEPLFMKVSKRKE